jgi:DNA-binding CsgD family transcriptional regulator
LRFGAVLKRNPAFVIDGWIFLVFPVRTNHTRDESFTRTESANMTEDKQLDHLIGVLYETALDPSRWQEAIGLCGLYTGSVEAGLLRVDKNTGIATSNVLGETFFDLSVVDSYMDHYMALDPRQYLVPDMIIHEWLCCHHFYDQHFVNHSEFFQDYFISLGARYSMFALVDDSQEHQHFVGLSRAIGQQPFGHAEQLAAQRFSGHLQRALRLQKHTQSLQTKAELGARAIDALALSMLIVDGKGVILHLNISAERLLNQRASGLACNKGCLYATEHSCKLTALLAEATGYPAVAGAMSLGGEEARQVFVTPLPAASPFSRDWQRPLALVFLIDSDKYQSAEQLMVALYDLSPAEMRVATALLNGKSPKEYANDAGVTMNAVRSQIQNLLSKTGACRQSELEDLLSGIPPLQG